MTERPGHARELAAAALARGVSTVLAWGGDGTVNEVASALAFRDAALAIIPSGSGNGLARELGIPLEPAGAFAVAFEGRELVIDAGELDGHLFFNIAGIGLDARVAHGFSAGGLRPARLCTVLEIAARELFTYNPEVHTIVTDGGSLRERALLIAIANARQYGNGALIAPWARVDDGQLDVVVIEHVAAARARAGAADIQGKIGKSRRHHPPGAGNGDHIGATDRLSRRRGAVGRRHLGPRADSTTGRPHQSPGYFTS